MCMCCCVTVTRPERSAGSPPAKRAYLPLPFPGAGQRKTGKSESTSGWTGSCCDAWNVSFAFLTGKPTKQSGQEFDQNGSRLFTTRSIPVVFHNPDPAYREKLLGFFPASIRSNIKFVIGAAGRLSPEKGFELLIEAAQAVSQKHPEVGFVLFGEGVLREPLQSQIDSSSLNDHFQLAGYTDELDQFMPCLDLFVQSSYTEGLPNVLLEAAAAGVAIVATKVGGTPEVVQPDDHCLLLEPGHSDQLADCILEIKTNSDNRTHCL